MSQQTYIHFPFYLLKGPRSNGTPLVMSTPILLPNYHSPIKKPRLFEEMADSMTGMRKIQVWSFL